MCTLTDLDQLTLSAHCVYALQDTVASRDDLDLDDILTDGHAHHHPDDIQCKNVCIQVESPLSVNIDHYSHGALFSLQHSVRVQEEVVL